MLIQFQEHREGALSRPLELAELEAALTRGVQALAARVSGVREQIDNVSGSEAALDAKLERRRAELQRAEKRLHTVQKIKYCVLRGLEFLHTVQELWASIIQIFSLII